MSSSINLEFHKRGWSSQRIARRETETPPKPKQRIGTKGDCPHCGRYFIKGLHLHVLKKHNVR